MFFLRLNPIILKALFSIITCLVISIAYMKLNSILIACLLPGFILLSSLNNIFAQDTVSDSSFYQKALENARTIYHQSFNNQSALYNGSKYGEYLFRFNEGHPFFNLPEPGTGSVIYDGIKYDSILMRYDEVRDLLVINAQMERIQLLSEKVEYFKLFNSDFIRLVKDSLSGSLVSSGFYNLLYKGKISLLKKQIKVVREVITFSEVQHFIDKKDLYYIKMDGRIYPIKKARGLFELFGSRKKEVQQFVKGNNLSFRKDKQNMLTRATAFYDSLKK